VHRVFAWIPGSKAGFDQLYEPAPAPCGGGHPNLGRSVSRIDAYLYAGNTIGGRANKNSYAINGGIIADHFHIISGAVCSGAMIWTGDRAILRGLLDRAPGMAG